MQYRYVKTIHAENFPTLDALTSDRFQRSVIDEMAVKFVGIVK